MSKLDAALDAARRGFSVFPIAPDSKVPLLKENWLQIATPDEAQIRQWWTDHPDANIAGLTGDKLVFDIDSRNGGLETWEALKAIEDFPETSWSRTAGGGAHMIYQMPEGESVKGGTHKAGPGIDIKAKGGYILLPGSTINGKPYQWGNKRLIARAPQWAIDRFQKAKERNDVAGKRLLEEDDIARELFEAWIRDHAPHADLGEIDDKTFKVCAQGYDFGCSQDTVYEIALGWNETHCGGLGDLERLVTVCESAGRNRDKAIGASHPLAPGFEAVEIDETKAPSMPGTEPGIKKPDELRIEGYFEAAGRALTAQAEPLIRGVMDRGAMSVLYGESNTGKTFVAVDQGFHVAAPGLNWAGKKTHHGAVLYVAAEGGISVYKRLAALRKHYPDVGDIPFYTVKFPVDLLHGPKHAAELVKLCKEAEQRSGQGLELITIDTLSRAMAGGDENSSTDMGIMVKNLDAIREATGAHVQVIHHSGKDRARGARGHSLLRAATDTEIEVQRGKLTVMKQRDMEGEFQQHFKLKMIQIGTDSEGLAVRSCVVELVKASEAGPVIVPPTGDETALLGLLRDRLERLNETSFGWKFVADTYLEAAWRKGKSEGAIYKVLQTLQTKQLVKKDVKGQYVIVPLQTLQTLQT